MVSTILLVLATLVAVFAGFWVSPASLKLRVAIDLLGWDGLANIAKQTVATRVLGKRQTKSRTAFHQMLEEFGDTELEYLVPNRRVTDDGLLAEGHRSLFHLLKLGLNIFYEADLDRPVFQPLVDPFTKLLGDNPDAFYLSALLKPETAYAIRGRKQGEDYVSFTVYGAKSIGGFVGAVISDVNNRGIVYEADGSYLLYVSPKRPAGAKNWISSEPSEAQKAKGETELQIISRHYYEGPISAQANPDLSVPKIDIVTVDPVTLKELPRKPTRPLTDAESAERIARVAHFVKSHSLHMPQEPSAAPKYFSFVPNVFGPASNRENMGEGAGAVDISYTAGPFKFTRPETEGLLVTGKMPKCVFANLVLWNQYLQSLGYERGNRVSMNRKQMKISPEGEYKILISANKPTKGPLADVDWLDSEGRASGTMFWRFLLPDEAVVEPKTMLVSLEGQF